MQRNESLRLRGGQEEKLITVGIDMGSRLWSTGITNWETKKQSHISFKGQFKAMECLNKIKSYKDSGYDVHVFYEAGRNGFTPSRLLKNIGVGVTVTPVSKLEILSSGKKVKTDKTDGRFLSGLHPSDKIPSVYIPTKEEESKRSARRELNRMKDEIKRKNNQIIGILERFIISEGEKHLDSKKWKERLKEGEILRRYLPEVELLRVGNLVKEMAVHEENISVWEEYLEKIESKDREKLSVEGKHSTMDKLMQFKGNAENISRALAWELGDFSRFKNGKSLSSYLGLCSVPWSSGKSVRDQGISKSGRADLRRLAVEMAWLWVKYQGECELVKKWKPKLEIKGRSRKTAIVALARQLMVALYRYIVHNEEIKGAVINRPLTNYQCGNSPVFAHG